MVLEPVKQMLLAGAFPRAVAGHAPPVRGDGRLPEPSERSGNGERVGRSGTPDDSSVTNPPLNAAA